MSEVLVLNNNYQPLNVTNVHRAIVLMCLGKVEVVRTNSQTYHSEHMSVVTPTVVRLRSYIRRPLPELRTSRKSILARDSHSCQYCGETRGALTIDHVTPRDRGGKTDWDNLVCCCTKCNNLKGNRTPDEAGMKLRRQPRRPKYIPYISYTKFVTALHNPHWQDFLAPYGEAVAATN
jgi:5-methylcytosine-specific restriction endonuclease McrA